MVYTPLSSHAPRVGAGSLVSAVTAPAFPGISIPPGMRDLARASLRGARANALSAARAYGWLGAGLLLWEAAEEVANTEYFDGQTDGAVWGPGQSGPLAQDRYWPASMGYTLVADLLGSTRWAPRWGRGQTGPTFADPTPWTFFSGNVPNFALEIFQTAGWRQASGTYWGVFDNKEDRPGFPAGWGRLHDLQHVVQPRTAGALTAAEPWPNIQKPAYWLPPLGVPVPGPTMLPRGYPISRSPAMQVFDRYRWVRRRTAIPGTITEVQVDMTEEEVRVIVNPTPRKPRANEKERKYRGKGRLGRYAATAAFWLYEAVDDWRDWLSIMIFAMDGAPAKIKYAGWKAQLFWLMDNPEAFGTINDRVLILGLFGWAIDEKVGAVMGSWQRRAAEAINSPLDIKMGTSLNQEMFGMSPGTAIALMIDEWLSQEKG